LRAPRPRARRTDGRMQVILVSTSDMRDDRGEVRARLLRSLVESERALGGNRIVLHLLLQNCGPQSLAEFAAEAPRFVVPTATERRVPLSAARNFVLRGLKARAAIGADALVAFPDDDCWYPEGFLHEVVRLFERHDRLDLWFCRYGSRPVRAAFADSAPAPARASDLVRNASSNTIFLRGRVVNGIGEFDESLGVGTPMGGSEDLDYALCASRLSRQTVYQASVLVGHRDKSPQIRARYYRSSLVVLARQAGKGAVREYLRKIAVGLYLTMRRELPPADFLRALREALLARRARRRMMPQS
jgi:hypothetical protein